MRVAAEAAGAARAVVCEHHARGGEGAVDLAHALIEATSGSPSSASPALNFTYDLSLPIEEKINAIATKVYGASGVELSAEAKAQAEKFEKQGFGRLPICMAKTQYSFSADPSAKGAPSGFIIPVRELRPSAGAGFLVALVGEMQTIPGLPTRPGFFNIDIAEDGSVVGLS